jgi:hypothetical protein
MHGEIQRRQTLLFAVISVIKSDQTQDATFHFKCFASKLQIHTAKERGLPRWFPPNDGCARSEPVDKYSTW